MRPRPITRLWLLLMMLASVCGGCFTFTTQEVPPGTADDIRSYRARGLRVSDGATTRDEIARLLGAADYVDEQGRSAAYRWQVVRYEKSYPDYGNVQPEEGLPTMIVYYSLLLRFDEAGVVAAHRKVSEEAAVGGPQTLPQLLAEWRDDKFASR